MSGWERRSDRVVIGIITLPSSLWRDASLCIVQCAGGGGGEND